MVDRVRRCNRDAYEAAVCAAGCGGVQSVRRCGVRISWFTTAVTITLDPVCHRDAGEPLSPVHASYTESESPLDAVGAEI
jgi:hypothetical protein